MKDQFTLLVTAGGKTLSQDAWIVGVALFAAFGAAATLSYDSGYQNQIVSFNNSDAATPVAVFIPLTRKVLKGTKLYCNSGDNCSATVVLEPA